MRKVEQFIRDAEPIRMSDSEKALMRSRISAFMDAHPAVPRPVRSPYVFISRWTEAFSVRTLKSHYALVAMAALLMTGGGVTAAANGALPGDALYPVKVKFNEEVTGALALSVEQKAAHESSLASRRVEEATTLSAQGRLTAEARAMIESDLETHVENLGRQVEKLAKNDNVRKAVEVNSELESTLRVHEKVLLDLTDKSGEAGTMASAIRQELTSVSQSLNSLEKKIGNEVSAEAERQARLKSLQAEKRLNESRTLIGEKAKDAKPEALAQANRYIDNSLQSLSEGYGKMEIGSYNKAFVLFQKAIRYSKQAELVVVASSELKIDVAPTKLDVSKFPPKATTTASTTPTASSTTPGVTATSTSTTTLDVTGSTTDAVELFEDANAARPKTGLRGLLRMGF